MRGGEVTGTPVQHPHRRASRPGRLGHSGRPTWPPGRWDAGPPQPLPKARGLSGSRPRRLPLRVPGCSLASPATCLLPRRARGGPGGPAGPCLGPGAALRCPNAVRVLGEQAANLLVCPRGPQMAGLQVGRKIYSINEDLVFLRPFPEVESMLSQSFCSRRPLRLLVAAKAKE